MNTRNRFKFTAILIMCLYCGVSIFMLSSIGKDIRNEYIRIEGSGAQNIASVIANTIEISDNDVKKLKSINYIELPENKINKKLENFTKQGLSQDVRSIYLFCKLDKDEIKYYAQDEIAKMYNLDEGTALDITWLLDVPVGETEKKEANENSQEYYKDVYRYSVLRGLEPFYNEKKSGYLYEYTEWGHDITGVAPIWTVEGNYAGMIGVDIFDSDLNLYSKKARQTIYLMYFIINISLIAMFLLLYRNYMRVSMRNSYLDALTGVYSRGYLMDQMLKTQKSINRSNSDIAVFMMDIDNFKKYNDYYGHIEGDICIKKVSEIIKNSINRDTDFVARYGGEEFTAVLPFTDKAGALRVAEKIRSSIEREFAGESNITPITISIGVCHQKAQRDAGVDIKDMIKRADDALYTAKELSKNTVIQSN